MTWTTERTWTTGELETATLFNTYIRDNLNASFTGVASTNGDMPYASGANSIVPLGIGNPYQVLSIGSGAAIPSWRESYAPIDIVVTDAVVSNTTTETTIYTSPDIGSNFLGTTGGVYLDMIISYLNTVATPTVTITVKLDSTAIFTPSDAVPHGSSATKRVFRMRYSLTNKSSASSQYHFIEYYKNSGGAIPLSGPTGIQPAGTWTNENTSAVDLSSGTHNIVVTFQHGTASPSITATMKFAALYMARTV